MHDIMDNIVEDQENLREFLDEADLQQYYELFRDILKVNKLSQLKFVAIEDLSQIGLSKPEQRRYKKLYSRYFPNSYMTKLKRLFNGNKKNEMGQVLKDFQTVRDDMNVYVPKTHIISIEDIIINKKLGMGHFGVVQQGKWLTGNEWVEVAIKCLGNDRMTSNSSEFLKEAAVMHRMAHPNIVRLYGVVLHLDSLMLVTELAPFRSLLECFHEDTLRCNFSVSILCEFAEQICNGMTYLTNERLIHRDLAARNILVFSKNKVKISDFGLSRALGAGKDYYQSKYNKNLKLPVAWCAPECILYLKFTTASDVWAFGVCLWEMFTYGAQPWEAFNGQQILDAINTPNFQRLERPKCCTEAYYSLMMECWSHEPGARPTFEDLMPRLRALRPEQVQTTVSFKRPADGRRNNFLEYKLGQIITVLGKENYTKSAMWYGALPGGACGMFDPKQTKPCIKHERGSYASSLSPHQTRNSSRSIRSSLLRSDVKRHTYTGKRTIHRGMISSPQGDVKHTGHVGLDGAYFGDLSFLDSAGCPPRQIVTPYKPSDDLEQVPLINPNSPSHLTTNTSSYPLLNSSKPRERDEVDLSYADKSKSVKKAHKSILEPTTSLLNKVKSATLGRSHKNEEATKHNEVHEYHEISDTDTESIAAEMQGDYPPDSPVMKGCGDFSQSLLAEMESIFKGFDEKRNDEVRNMENEVAMALRTLALSKMDKRKGSHTGTMKPMSAHDEKTLNTAVALANEITSRSMTDLDGEQKPSYLPSEKSKFHFKFPLVSSLHATHHDAEKEANNKAERRNFSEEAKSVPDIHATITEESKQAYVSLIEEPTPSSSLVPHMSQAAATLPKPSTVPKPAPRTNNMNKFLSLPKKTHTQSEDILPRVSSVQQDPDEKSNVIPLLPRGAKPKLVDKPRHIRKYPLKIPSSYDFHETPAVQAQAKPHTIIYQNTLDFAIPRYKVEDKHPEDLLNVGVDVFDGPDTKIADTNPFTAMQNEMIKPGSSSVNPFKYYLTETSDDSSGNCEGAVGGVIDSDEVSLNKDHVSVEDLLEFADQKPSARQRGVESDEVRIMNKVLKQQVKAEDCLEALEFSGWNVHIAIKLLHVKIAVGKDVEVSFEECQRELDNADGDIAKAAGVIILYNKDKQN